MGLLERLGIRKSSVNNEKGGKTFSTQDEEYSSFPKNSKVSAMLEKTKEKARKYGGDPFYEYRKKGILPDKFEYGMNCFLDRIAEEHSEEVAQKTYEELKKIPGGCKIIWSAGEDIPGIPILLSVRGIAPALKAYNAAAEKLGIDKKTVYSLEKESLIRMILEGSNLTVYLFKKTAPKTVHAVLARLSDIFLDSEPLFAKAVDFHKSGKYKEALDFYNKAIEAEPLDARAWLNKGTILAEQKNFKEAIECFDQVINIAPKMAGGGAWINKAYALEELGENKKALVCFDEALKINPKRFGLWNSKARIFLELKRYDEALKCIDRAIELEPSELILWRNKADILLAMGRYKESVDSCDRALQIDDKNADVWNIKGLAFFIKLKNYEEALKCFNKALKIHPNFDEAWLNKSQVLSKLGKYIEAVKCVEKAVEINPKRAGSWEVLNDLSAYLTEIGEFKKAVECIDKATQLEPSNSMLWNNKAGILIVLKKFEEAKESSDRALEINPKLATAWFHKGLALFHKEMEGSSKEVYGGFLKYFKLALKLDPEISKDPVRAEFIKRIRELGAKDNLGEDYAHKLLVMRPKYLQKLEDETDTQYARKWTVISLGFLNRGLKLMAEGKPLEVERLALYQEVIGNIMSATFRNYENNPNREFHIDTPNINFALGRWIAELLPSDEDPQFEKFVSILSESLLPKLLPIVPDIKRDSGKENEYDEKFSSALPIVISKLHDEICILRKEGKYLEERVWLTLKKLIIKEYIVEYRIDNLKNKDKKVWVKVVNDLIDLLRDENKEAHTKAIRTLGEIGEPAIESLIEAFREENNEVCTGIMATLKNIGEPAVNPLIMALKDENEKVRYYAAITLGIISKSVAVNPLPLIDALRDENKKVRGGAIYALGEIGEPAIESLIESFRDENEEIRISATAALIEIGEPTIEPLTAILNNNNENEIVRRYAALCLKKIAGNE